MIRIKCSWRMFLYLQTPSTVSRWIWFNFELQTYSSFELLKMPKYYFIILFKTVWRKQISTISEHFIIQHNINNTNMKVSTHYWIIIKIIKLIFYKDLWYFCFQWIFQFPLECTQLQNYQNMLHYYYSHS